jgi:hypothetical protein
MEKIVKKSVFFVEILLNHVFQRHFVTCPMETTSFEVEKKVKDHFTELHKDEKFFSEVKVLKVSREAKQVISL